MLASCVRRKDAELEVVVLGRQSLFEKLFVPRHSAVRQAASSCMACSKLASIAPADRLCETEQVDLISQEYALGGEISFSFATISMVILVLGCVGKERGSEKVFLFRRAAPRGRALRTSSVRFCKVS